MSTTKRPTRRKSATRRTVDEEEKPRPKRRGGAKKRSPRSKAKPSLVKLDEQTRIVHLAISPKAANILRTMIAKSRHNEPILDQIQKELESQLK